LRDLPIHKPSSNIIQELHERGKHFHNFAPKISYVNYVGDLIKYTWERQTPIKYRATGRIMIDYNTFKEMNSDYPKWDYGREILDWNDD